MKGLVRLASPALFVAGALVGSSAFGGDAPKSWVYEAGPVRVEASSGSATAEKGGDEDGMPLSHEVGRDVRRQALGAAMAETMKDEQHGAGRRSGQGGGPKEMRREVSGHGLIGKLPAGRCRETARGA